MSAHDCGMLYILQGASARTNFVSFRDIAFSHCIWRWCNLSPNFVTHKCALSLRERARQRRSCRSKPGSPQETGSLTQMTKISVSQVILLPLQIGLLPFSLLTAHCGEPLQHCLVDHRVTSHLLNAALTKVTSLFKTPIFSKTCFTTDFCQSLALLSFSHISLIPLRG